MSRYIDISEEEWRICQIVRQIYMQECGFIKEEDRADNDVRR